MDELSTLISFFSFRLKHAQTTFLWPGLRPSATDGMERTLSAIEKRINSLLMKSEYEISSVSWSRYVPGCGNHESMTDDHSKGLKGCTHPKLSQPLLTVVCFFLAKCEFDEFAVPVLRRAERDHVLRHVREVVASVRIFARPETLKESEVRKGR